MIKCIDVSSAQRTNVDWRAVRESGIDAVWVKATEGAKGIDPAYKAHRDGASLAGLTVGAYHFCRPDAGPVMALGALRKEAITADARAEAERFFAASEGWGAQSETLPPLVDLEAAAPGLSTGDLLVWLGAHLLRAEELFGVMPVVYTGAGFTQKYPDFARGEWLREYHLMLAAYPLPHGRAMSFAEAAAREPPQLSPWGRPSVWQFSGGGGNTPGNVVAGFGGAVVDCSLMYSAPIDLRTPPTRVV